MTDRDEPDRPDEPEPERDDAEQEPDARRGQIRFQDPETTKPRAPTLGEQRARKRAIEQEREREVAEREEAERKSRLRRRILIGSGVTVGVVAVVAVWYTVATPDEVTANCVTNDSVLASNENFCDENYVRSQGGYHSGGFFFVPIPGGGFNQYRYHYGGNVGPGGRVTGGSTVAPGGRTTVKTSSGKTVQRGGFGVSSGGKSGGG